MKIYLIVEDFKGKKRVGAYAGTTIFEDRSVAESYANSLRKVYGYLNVSYYVREVEL